MHASHQAQLRVAAAADRGLLGARRLLDRMQLRLRAWQAANDPALAVWVEQTKKDVASGAIAERIANQTPISELAAKWRAEHPGE